MASSNRSAKRPGSPPSPVPPAGGRDGAATPQGRFGAALNWIKSNTIVATVIAVAGIITPVSALVAQTDKVIPVVLKTLDIPDCYKYADTYYDKWSEFRREGKMWREYPRAGGPYSFEFNELHRSRDTIQLVNLTPRAEIPEWKTMVVSLPVCGGKARFAVGIPERWNDLFEVWTASN
jgi:hypothetical protein